ncbi:M20/M25/M40 family metallo-hydrolase [Rhodohalobacter sp. SW132]|uniref:M20/M25/M40 family metallo-hydrolase n=1 Tax=Rhodohalobacter sp. SW132 TaxID=2293433 RepID=UPI001F1E53B6|nr:M20/M25/M40 family metallo-hydrolase [Rhodohalobacter sp. SW132]
MKVRYLILSLFLIASFNLAVAQSTDTDSVVEQIVNQVEENSHLEELAHHLLDVIGPRLVGTPQQQHAHDWAVEKFAEWGIEARNEQYGEWRGWERGITHVDMVYPRVVSLEAMQLAWSPSTPAEGVTAGLVIIPEVEDRSEFEDWLPNVEGKFVMISMHQPTGRPGYNWDEWATEESKEAMQQTIAENTRNWRSRMQNTGLNTRSYIEALEEAGAAGIVISNWSQGFGTNRIFGANTSEIPTIDVLLEDYGMLYRLVENGHEPEIRVRTESEDLGMVPTFNTIAEIPGTEKPDEYIILSAHYDSWDGGTGATDNGTGSITMMEVARILSEVYPNPKRTILVGLWGGEEQGLNGSRAFVEDNPEIVDGVQALFNQDNGTGRVVSIQGEGFIHSYEYFTRWLSAVPSGVTDHIETNFPGMPSGGGTDHASFVAAGAPAFMMRSLSWDYWNYTWHTNRDTYDKIVFDDVKNNVKLIATLAYMASEDPETFDRERRVMPIDPRTGEQREWPQQRSPNRSGGN